MVNKLIVGLGNPGAKYELNRHNAGFLIIDDFACKHNINISKKRELCIIGNGSLKGCGLMLVKPLTFMNKSGFAVQRLLAYYKLEPKDLVVVHDDLDIEFGQLKVKQSGGHGGHNGIRSIMQSLGAGDFTRLRFGIGRPPGQMPAEKYVLANFSCDDEELGRVIERGVEILETIITEGNVAAMNRFH